MFKAATPLLPDPILQRQGRRAKERQLEQRIVFQG
ncbi:hypothetical protein LINPERHAP2_LOCUS2771 [Linum perenne]